MDNQPIKVDRSKFTPGGINPDCPVPISDTCTVPTEAMAVLLANLLETEGKVLEIGTGSGYQTAILAARCKEVVSVEVQPSPEGLADKLPPNVTLIVADGCTYDSGEQFDGILVTYAAPMPSPVWMRQLKQKAKLVIPLKLGATCRICVFERCNNMLRLLGVKAYAPFTDSPGEKNATA